MARLTVAALLVACSALAAGCVGAPEAPPAPPGQDARAAPEYDPAAEPPPTEPYTSLVPPQEVEIRVLAANATRGNATACGPGLGWCHVVDVELRNLGTGRVVGPVADDWRGRTAPRTGTPPIAVQGALVPDGATGTFSLAFPLENETLRIVLVRFVPEWLAGPLAASVPPYDPWVPPREAEPAPDGDGDVPANESAPP